ncbi:ORF6N domain-containing protein [Mitsuokella jalaludinii]|uniref:ORF6N domain-containing protein n=1 Tax=Mitsuokella jalaludinii TaxID=187979 RepID=UPI00307998F4
MANEIMKPVEYHTERVLTTEQLAEAYGCDAKRISENFKRNMDRFEEGKHYFKLVGQDLKSFKASVGDTQIADTLKFTSVLCLWTRRGASRHSKMLGTDRAWDMFDKLEENYFNPVIHTPSYLIENQVERAKAWIVEQEKLLETQKELDVAKPLAQQTQRYIDNDHLIGFRELCKELNVKETDMNKLLLENNWKYRTKSGKLKYHKWVVTKGYMETKDTMNEDTGWSGTSDKFTIKGRMKIEELIQNEAVE